MKCSNRGTRIAIAALCIFVAQSAFAQYASDFESLNASAGGTLLTGQDGYFLPNGAASDEDFLAYTYSGNALGLPQNPNGGRQFVGGTGPAGGRFARAQRLSGFSPTGTWTIASDIAATFTGTLPTVQNVGSLSINEGVPGVFSLIMLARWVDPVTATGWNADFVWFDGIGTQLIEQVANPDFQNLAVNHWYRWSTTFSLDTNQVLETRLTDLTNGNTFVNNPVDRWLLGGVAGDPMPDHHRFFGGGGVPGNSLAFDNPAIVPEPASMIALGLGLAALAARRRRKKK